MNKQSWQFGALAGLLGLVSLLGAVLAYLAVGQFGPFSVALTAVGAVLLGVFIWSIPDQTKGTTGGRYMRYGGNTIVALLAFAAILGLLNLLASRHSAQWDVTANQQFSISQQTIKVLQSLKDPVTVTTFFQSGDPNEQTAKDLFRSYTQQTDKIKVDYVDPDTKPAVARQFQITAYGTVVFQSGDKRQDITSISESDFTGALLKLTTTSKTVYFLTGHGERSIDSGDRESYTQLRDALKNDNYTVETLNLATNPTLTPDMGVLIIAGPTAPLLDQEKQAIQSFIDQGGKVMLMEDPGTGAPLDDLVKKWNLQFGQGIAVDPAAAFYNDAATIVVSKYPWSPITNNMPMTIFPYARSVVVPPTPPQDATVTQLVATSDRSWLETDTKVAHYDAGVDTQGPLALGVTVETNAPTSSSSGQSDKVEAASNTARSRLVLFGNSEFASNSFLAAGGNRDLFVNSVNWLSESEDQIAISPKAPDDRSVVLTSNQTSTVIFTSAIFVPALVLLAGVSVWWKRR